MSWMVGCFGLLLHPDKISVRHNRLQTSRGYPQRLLYNILRGEYRCLMRGNNASNRFAFDTKVVHAQLFEYRFCSYASIKTFDRWYSCSYLFDTGMVAGRLWQHPSTQETPAVCHHRAFVTKCQTLGVLLTRRMSVWNIQRTICMLSSITIHTASFFRRLWVQNMQIMNYVMLCVSLCRVGCSQSIIKFHPPIYWRRTPIHIKKFLQNNNINKICIFKKVDLVTKHGRWFKAFLQHFQACAL